MKGISRLRLIAIRLICVTACVTIGYVEASHGYSIDALLTLQGAPFALTKGSTTTRKIGNVPTGMSGYFRIEMKWHAQSLIPNTFNKLKVELLYGSSAYSTVKQTRECYSIHANYPGACNIYETVSDSEAAGSGEWFLRISNQSDHDADGINLRKESTELNPFVPNFTSRFVPDCSARSVTFRRELTIEPFSIVEDSLGWSSTLPGRLSLKAKWHSDTLIPNVFKPLKAELLVGNSVRTTDVGYSIHSSQKDKLSLVFDLSGVDTTRLPAPVKLRLTNSSEVRLKGFSVSNGSDFLAPQFRSTFTPDCS